MLEATNSKADPPAEAPFRSRIGTVYGALLNDAGTIARMAPAFAEPPYRAAPKAPVLYIKPRNTFAEDGAAVAVPADPGCVRIDATIGAVIGRRATRVAAADAASFVAGWVVVSDVTLPHDSVYRPAVRLRCRDGFCPIGAIASPSAFDPDAATLTVAIDDAVVLSRSFATLVRPFAALLADVTAFMTLDEGDVLLLGPPEGAPLARPGATVRIDVPGLGSLTHRVVAEESS